MWSSVLVLALLAGLDPVRLGWTLLVVSRPRPMQNLLAYWAGTMIVSVPYMLGPLMVLHVTPRFTSFTHDWATNSTARHMQIGSGVLLLSIAALMTVRTLMRRRRPAQLPATGGTTSTLVLDSNTPTATSPLLGRAQDAPTEDESAFRRLLGRFHKAWESGSLWIALVIGIACVPPADAALFILAITVTSGAAIGTQLSAAIVFVVGTLAVVEIMLVSYLAAPVKTQAALRLLHDWALAHRRQVLVAMFAVAGVSAVAHGMGIV
jgi:ABC-type nickel/cobalt efflux system permease component RcnA